MSTYSFGSSTLRDQSKKRLPGSARVASVKLLVSSIHWSAYSCFTFHFTQMKIMSLSSGRLRVVVASSATAQFLTVARVQAPGGVRFSRGDNGGRSRRGLPYAVVQSTHDSGGRRGPDSRRFCATDAADPGARGRPRWRQREGDLRRDRSPAADGLPAGAGAARLRIPHPYPGREAIRARLQAAPTRAEPASADRRPTRRARRDRRPAPTNGGGGLFCDPPRRTDCGGADGRLTRGATAE